MSYFVYKKIDYTALAQNIEIMQKRYTTKLYPVVKANAYGFGYSYVMPILYTHGLTDVFTATAQEAVAIHKVSDRGRTYVLSDILENALPTYIKYNHIYPVLNSAKEIKMWAQRSHGKACIIHIDTGINRLGVSPSEYSVFQDTSLINKANPLLFMTHLASTKREKAQKQVTQFLQCIQPYPNVKKSVIATGGISLGNDFFFDGIRIGEAFYGTDPEETKGIQSILSVEAKLLSVFHIEANECVGYGWHYTSRHPMRLGTVAMGYADGLPYNNSTGNFYYKGQKLSILGDTSMDMTTISLTGVTHQPNIGDFIEVVGPHQTLTQWKEDTNTMGASVTFSFLRTLSVRTQITVQVPSYVRTT